MSIKTTKVLGCIKCSMNKSPSSHTYGKYKVVETTDFFSLRCSTCGHIVRITKFEKLKEILTKNIEDADDIIYHQAKIIDMVRGIEE